MFINKALGRKLGYDPDADFAFVGMLGAFPNLLLTNPDVIPAKIARRSSSGWPRTKPGTLSYGSNGIGSLAHLTTEVFAEAAGVKFLHVPYQGAAPQLADLLSGRIGFTVVGPQGMLPHIKEGKLRALAVTTGIRYPVLPEVPTLVESGFPALDAPVWFAAYVRASTPPAATARLRTRSTQVNQSPEYEAGLAKLGAQRMEVPAEGREGAIRGARRRCGWTRSNARVRKAVDVTAGDRWRLHGATLAATTRLRLRRPGAARGCAHMRD